MKREDVHALWAPDGDPWRSWVKPVLFASLPREVAPKSERRKIGDDPTKNLVDALEEARPVGYRRRAGGDAAIVIDLPGVSSVDSGVALAQRGFRPVPLFNAVPTPSGHNGVVDVEPIMDALVDGAPLLRDVPSGGAPCFLLDDDRLGDERRVWGGIFDNRSICRTTDFPSAEALVAAGIRRFVVVHIRPLQHDLAAVLLDWQNGGLTGHRFYNHRLLSMTVRGPSLVRRLVDFFRNDALGARPDGSFGKTVPQGG